MARQVEHLAAAFAAFLFGSLVASVAPAQSITTDGTLGAKVTLSGPNYPVTADLGKQVGGNLFHSFGIFGLNKGESATFSGPGTVTNVIGRVTGGSASSINGKIDSSSIAGANLYLINPSGIVFGPSATVNVSGSFHASTADYLRLSDGAKFQATNPSGSTLSAAAPAAFGFLTATPPAITVNGSAIGVNPGQTIGLVGGPVSIAGANLSAPAGTIHVTSVASPGEIPAAANTGTKPTVTARGPVSVTGGSLLNVSDPVGLGSGGSVFIRAGTLTIDASQVNADNYGAGAGGRVTLQADGAVGLNNGANIQALAHAGGSAGAVTITTAGALKIDGTSSGILTAALPGSTGNAGNVTITAGTLDITNDGQIIGATFGSGKGGDVSATVAGALTIDGSGSTITTGALSSGAGNAGNVTLTAGTLSIVNGGVIFSPTVGSGHGGDVSATVAGALTIDGTSAGITAGALPGSTGNAGNITVTARTLSILNSGVIGSATFGPGNAGDVSAIVAGALTIDGTDSGIGAGITSGTHGLGNGGKVTVTAQSLSMFNNGVITTASFGPGNGGDIAVVVTGPVTIDGTSAQSTMLQERAGFRTRIIADALINEATFGFNGTPEQALFPTAIAAGALSGSTGNGGNVTLTAGTLSIVNNGVIFTGTFGPGNSGDVSVSVAGALTINGPAGNSPVISGVSLGTTGNAGNINISSGTLSIADNGVISSHALTANGGNIAISVRDLLSLRRGEITTQVDASTGNGGNITIDSPVVVLDGGRIIASALGSGLNGNIDIRANAFIESADSTVTATGAVTFENPPADVGTALVTLPSTLRNAAAILRDSCAARAGVPHSILIQAGRGGLPQDPEATIPALYLAGRDADPASPTAASAAPPSVTLQRRSRLTMPCADRSGS